PDLQRKIALKLLRADRVRDTESGGERLRREAQTMARLDHPGVVTVLDFGSYDDQVFVAMEFVEGQTLAAWLRARRRGWREVVDALVKAGHGIAAAHEAGLVHRDIKPENVLVGCDGRVRVTDFGLARIGAGPIAAAQIADQDLTTTGVVVGT